VRTETAGGVRTIVLDRPEVLNAMDPGMRFALLDEFERADDDESVRAVVITGAGRGFCSGADLRNGVGGFAPGAAPDGPYRDGGGALVRRMLRMGVPVIAAVNGPAFGIGAALTLGADVRIAARSARFGFVYTRLGIAPEGLSSWLLRETVGLPRAIDWLLSGRAVDAPEAFAAGLVREVVAEDGLLDRALEVAQEYIRWTSPAAVAVTRRLVWGQVSDSVADRAHELESRLVPHLAAGPDAAEAAAARRERRRPLFAAPRTHVGDYPFPTIGPVR
jgi:enoyl-CoA hydratase/carnithine racemase